MKDGVTNTITAPDLDTFINADFDELWKQLTTPQPTIHLDGKDLLNYVRHDAAAKEKQHFQ